MLECSITPAEASLSQILYPSAAALASRLGVAEPLDAFRASAHGERAIATLQAEYDARMRLDYRAHPPPRPRRPPVVQPAEPQNCGNIEAVAQLLRAFGVTADESGARSLAEQLLRKRGINSAADVRPRLEAIRIAGWPLEGTSAEGIHVSTPTTTLSKGCVLDSARVCCYMRAATCRLVPISVLPSSA